MPRDFRLHPTKNSITTSAKTEEEESSSNEYKEHAKPAKFEDDVELGKKRHGMFEHHDSYKYFLRNKLLQLKKVLQPSKVLFTFLRL